MLKMEYIVDTDKALSTLMFDQKVMRHLQCKCDDYVLLLQSIHCATMFTLVKVDNGYRIKRVPNQKKTYQIHISHKFNVLREFDMRECTYYLKNNNIIKFKLKL